MKIPIWWRVKGRRVCKREGHDIYMTGGSLLFGGGGNHLWCKRCGLHVPATNANCEMYLDDRHDVSKRREAAEKLKSETE